ncbi:hypothetical protein DFJ74DRAFT_679630 [Hyaloraphidium curvatum]|nr:hypothetical protein DFJ74DRAFT_679630 [Hyaloraphidium curvatum]
MSAAAKARAGTRRGLKPGLVASLRLGRSWRVATAFRVHQFPGKVTSRRGRTMAKSKRAKAAPSRRVGQPRAPKDGDATLVPLPPELLLAVMEILEGQGHKRTLLEFLWAFKDMLALGMGLLVRSLHLLVATLSELDPDRLLDKFRGLLSVELTPWKLSRVEKLSVAIWELDPFHAELLREIAPPLKVLEIRATSRPGVERFLDSIGTAPGRSLARRRGILNGDRGRRHGPVWTVGHLFGRAAGGEGGERGGVRGEEGGRGEEGSADVGAAESHSFSVNVEF